MPERFYEQDPNTGQRYYTEKGWSEWKPVPVEKNPETGEEYELWNEQWVKRSPMDEKPAEMPSLDKGGMAVAGSPNMAADRMRRWSAANPAKAARARKIINSGREIDPGGALGTEIGMVLGGEWDANKPMDYATLSKAVKERGQREVEAKFDQQALEGEVKKFEGMNPFRQAIEIIGRAVLSGVPTGVKGLVDIVRTIDDVITQSGAGDYRTVPLHLVKKHVLDPLAGSLDYTANTFQIKDTLDKAWGPKAKHWTEPLKPILQLPSVAAEMAPQLMAGNAAALEGMGAKAGDFTLKTLTRMGVPKALRVGAAESVAGAVANAPQQIIMDSFNEWGNATQDIRKQLIDQGASEEEATQKALHQTRNLLQQNLALNTMLAPLDAVSAIYGKTSMAKRIASMEASKASKAMRAVTGSLDAVKTMAAENFQERSQEALTMLAEQGKPWSYDGFMENFNSDRAKEAGMVGGAFGLAMHVGGEFAESRAKKAAAKEQASRDAQIRAGAAALQEEVAAKQAQEQTATERAMAAPETSVAAEIERGVRPQEREAVEAIAAQAEPMPAPRPEGLSPELAPAFEQVEGTLPEAAPAPEFYGADLVRQIQSNSMAVPQPLRGRVGMELREIHDSQRRVDALADMLLPIIERGQMPDASPNAIKAAEMAAKNLDEADTRHRGLVSQFESLTRPEVQRRILEARGGINAIAQRIVPESRVPEYQQAREGGQAPEAGGGNRLGVGGQVETQAAPKAEGQVARAVKPVPVRIKENGKTITHMVDDPGAIKEFRATMREDERAMSRIVNAPMTRAQRAEAIKAQKDKTAAKKRDIVDRWKNTRAAVKEATNLGAAQDITNALASAARIAYAVIQDLAAMGKVTFDDFMASMKTKPEYTALSRDLSEADFRRVYEQQRRVFDAGGAVRDESVGLRGERSAYGEEIPRDGEAVQDAGREFIKDPTNYESARHRFLQPGGKFYTRATKSGRVAITKIDGDLGVTVIPTEGKPWVVNFTKVGDTIHIDWITNGFDETRRKTKQPQVGRIIRGGFGDLIMELALHAKTMGADKIEGSIIGPTEFAARVRYENSKVGVVGPGMVHVSTPVSDILNGNSVHGQWLHQQLDQAFIDLDDDRITPDEFRAKVSQLRHGFTTEDFAGLQYAHAGLNPFAALDAILQKHGLQTIAGKLGINWNTATPMDYAQAIVKVIKGLGSTVKATAHKLKAALNLNAEDAEEMAQALHNMQDADHSLDPERYAEDVRKAVASLNPDDYKVSPEDRVPEELFKEMKNVPTSHEYWSLYHTVVDSKLFDKAMSKLPQTTQRAVYKNLAKDGWIGNTLRWEPFRGISHPKMIAARTKGNNDFSKLEDSGSSWNKTRERVVYSAQPMIAAVSSVATDPLQANILGTALNVGTVASGGIEFTDAQLKKAFPSITPETIKAYHATVAASKVLSREVLQSFLDRYEAERKRLEASIQGMTNPSALKRAMDTLDDMTDKMKKVKQVFSNPAYWPLTRRGRYLVSFSIPGTWSHVATVMIENKPDSNPGKREIIQEFNSAMDFNPALRKAYQNGEIDPLNDFEVVDKSQEFETLRKAGVEYMDHALFEALAAIGDVDKGVSDAVESILSARIAGDSMRSHMKHREGVAGAITDPVVAMNAFIHMASNTIANNYHGKEINDNLAAVTNPTGVGYDPGIAAYARRWTDDLKHPAPMNWGHTMNRLGFLQALAGATVFALAQRFQPLMTLLPTLWPVYGQKATDIAYAKAQILADKVVLKSGIQDLIERSIPKELGEKDSAELEKLLGEAIDKQFVTGTFESYFDGDKAKVAEMKHALEAVLHEAVTSGALRPSASSDLMAAAGSIEGIKTAAGRAVTLPASLSETSNRLAAIFTVAMLAVKTGKGFEYAGKLGRQDVKAGIDNIMQTAVAVNTFTNFVNSREGKLEFQRSKSGFVTAMSLFKAFIAQYVSLMHFVPLMEYRRQKALGSTEGKAVLAYLKARLGYDVAATLAGGPQASLDFAVMYAIAVGLSKLFDFDLDDWREEYVMNPIKESVAKWLEGTGMSKEGAKAVAERAKFAAWHGAPSAVMGIDLSASLRPDLFLGNGRDSAKEKFAGLVTGAWGSKSLEAAGALMEGKSIGTAAKQLEPRAMKGVREAISGTVNIGQGKEKLETSERLVRALAAQPVRISILREKVSNRYELLNEYSAIRTRAQEMANDAVDENGKVDGKQMAKALRYQRQWEKDNANRLLKYKINRLQPPTPKKVKRGMRLIEQMKREE